MQQKSDNPPLGRPRRWEAIITVEGVLPHVSGSRAWRLFYLGGWRPAGSGKIPARSDRSGSATLQFTAQRAKITGDQN